MLKVSHLAFERNWNKIVASGGGKRLKPELGCSVIPTASSNRDKYVMKS